MNEKGVDITRSQAAGLLDSFAELKVPHSWFASFYVLSVLASLFWIPQILLKTGLVPYITASSSDKAPTMTLQQVLVAWSLMLVQGARRLYESLAFGKPSSSQMWIGHWAVGVWFYAMVSVAIWIEGSPAIEHSSFAFKHFLFTGPSLRTFVGTLLFMLASGLQHDCHAYLASLKKYTLPEHPAFGLALCPHYFAECLIYVALSIIAAPSGQFVNRTIFCALVFVAINLGVTADGTKTWYEQKFGKDKIGPRARMLPFLY
ncbi:hypothetical protein MBLNU457_3466t2 [Dothideomycetes sp. NU457]